VYIKTKFTQHGSEWISYVPVHAMKAHGRMEIVLHILRLCTRWKWVVIFTRWLLYPHGKSPKPWVLGHLAHSLDIYDTIFDIYVRYKVSAILFNVHILLVK